MTKTIITLDTQRSCYSIEQVLNNYTTITVAELINTLKSFPPNSPVIFKNDNGYTYGHIYDSHIDSQEIDVETDLDQFKVGDRYRFIGDSDEVIFGHDQKFYVDTEVTILDTPDESGWVMAKIDNLNGHKDIETFVDVNALYEIE